MIDMDKRVIVGGGQGKSDDEVRESGIVAGVCIVLFVLGALVALLR